MKILDDIFPLVVAVITATTVIWSGLNPVWGFFSGLGIGLAICTVMYFIIRYFYKKKYGWWPDDK